MRNAFIVLLLILQGIGVVAQTTRDEGDPGEQKPSAKAKILVVPYDERMFNAESDITRSISAETGQNYKQMQSAFRRGAVDQMRRAFAGQYEVITLLDDTVKMKKDLGLVYNMTATEFIPVNSPLNPAPVAKTDNKNPKAPGGIQKGQVVAPPDEGEKFMNTKILSANLIPYLKEKYKCEYIVFLNQLDLQNDLGADPLNMQGNTNFKRMVVIHYTIFSCATNQRVAMGKVAQRFENTVNSPKRIVDGPLSTISQTIYRNHAAAVKPKK